METTRQRKARRKRERAERLYGPPGFADFVRAQPCRKCGRSPSEVHHDPPEGLSKRGHWTNTTPLCTNCHTMAPDSRHEHTGGHEGFWGDLCTTREEENAKIQARWLAYSEGLAD